jgi:methanogenesis marker radical SAM protein
VGGRAGIDCGGFCEFCFYKNVNFNKLVPMGCVNCPPDKVGCFHCQNIFNRINIKFKTLLDILTELKMKVLKEKWLFPNIDLNIFIGGGADVLNYPYLLELISILKEEDYFLNIGYTSGKPIKNENIPKKIISLGADEVDFSVFSTNPEIRRKWMNDETSEDSIKGLKLFCENIDVNASAVIMPEINDGNELFETCVDLEEWGIKSLTLRRFANFKHQGLLFTENPLIKGVNTHSYEEFCDLVQEIGDEFSFEVLGYPIYDPKNESPFVISKTGNRDYLKNLHDIKSEATIITSKLAAPYLKKIFGIIDEDNLVNIVNVDKEIADLIVHEDLESINLNEMKEKVIIPSGALVHDNQCEKIFTKDGKHRRILRGPYILTYPYIEDKHLTSKEELIKYELESFNALIDKINS